MDFFLYLLFVVVNETVSTADFEVLNIVVVRRLVIFFEDPSETLCTHKTENKYLNYFVFKDFQLWLKNVGTSGLKYDTSSSEVITITCSDGTNDITSTYTVDITDEVRDVP